MDLDITKWYVRIFFWSLGIWDKFWENWNTGPQYTKGTNLCHAVRVIFVWMPLVLALHAALYLGMAFTLIALPIHYFGWGRYLTTMEVLGLIVLAIVFMVLIVMGFSALRDRVRGEQPYSPPAPRVKKEKKPREPGIWQLIGAWFVSLKKKTCLILTFHHPSEETRDA